ncbi:MAG TPA: DUF5615 family PIN-like protein [Lacipirellulaceae bacterium]|nr:DUF5615 family PIN-like protein [Lacipirellulaceae bacterium]
MSDDDVLRQTNNQKAVLLTADKDFGELVFRQNRVHSGVVLVRLFGVSAELKAGIVVEAIQDHGDKMPGSFAVISVGIIRIRRHS